MPAASPCSPGRVPPQSLRGGRFPTAEYVSVALQSEGLDVCQELFLLVPCLWLAKAVSQVGLGFMNLVTSLALQPFS